MLLFAFCSDCHTTTPDPNSIPLPANGGFEKNLNSFAPDGLPYWNTTHSPSVGATFLAAQDNLTFYSGHSSFHSVATVPASTFGWSGIAQNLTQHYWTAPLVSNIIFKAELYPVQLISSDSLIVFRFDMSYWDQAITPTRMYFVFHNSSVTGINSAFQVQNDTDTVVFDMTGRSQMNVKQWNALNWNLTDYAIKGFGDYWRGIDNQVLALTVQSWSRNSATSEFYLDSLSLKSNLGPQPSHQNELNILAHYNSTSPIPLISGVTDFEEGEDMIWFGTNSYPMGTGSLSQDLSNIRNGGGYPLLSAPFTSPTMYNVNALPIHSDASAWAGTGPWALGGIGLWDQYLNAGYNMTGYVQQHPYIRSAIINYAKNGGPATYVYSDSLTWPSIVEAIAQGRSFGEYGWIFPRMNLYFTTENDAVPMGRFPVYVDSATTTVSVHVKVDPIPVLASQLSIRIIQNGAIVETIPIAQPKYDSVLSFPLKSSTGIDSFRYEVYSVLNPILAYSNPIIFVRTAALSNGVSISETPGLAYGTANSFLSDITQTSTRLSFKVNAIPGLAITTSIYSPKPPQYLNLPPSFWQYDTNTKIMTVTTTGTQQVTVSYVPPPPDFHLSISQTVFSTMAGYPVKIPITLQSLYGYYGPLSLSTSISPTGVSTEIVPTGVSTEIVPSMTLTSGATVTLQLTVTSSFLATLQSYTVTVTATNGTVSRVGTVQVTLTKPPDPDLNVTLSPSNLTIVSTDKANSTIVVNSLYGFSGDVNLFAQITPGQGLTCTVNPNQVHVAETSPSATSLLSCSGGLGNYNVTITATSGLKTRSGLLQLRIQGFTIFATQVSNVVLAGETGTANVVVNAGIGFTSPILLSSTMSPDTGLTCSLSTLSVTGHGASIISCNGVSGVYTVSIVGTSGSLSYSTYVIFTVQDFTLQISPNSIRTESSGNATFTITATRLQGFPGNISLSYSGDPSRGLSCTLSGGQLQPGLTSSSLDCRAAPGSYTITITGRDGSLTHSAIGTVSVSERTSNLPTILGYWPYIVIAAAATIIAGTLFFLRKRKESSEQHPETSRL